MKINVISIIRDHLRTLKNYHSGMISVGDVFLFYASPVFFGIVVVLCEFTVDLSGYNISITFFGIFLALLLNIQVAVFAVFQRKWEAPRDSRIAEIQRDSLRNKRLLLGEINSNISYLILLSSVSLIFVLTCFLLGITSPALSSILVGLYSHFMLTLFMIIKRAHSIFQREYSEDSQ